MAGETVIHIAHVDTLIVGAQSPVAPAERPLVTPVPTMPDLEPDIIATRSDMVAEPHVSLEKELESIDAQIDVDRVRAEQYVPVDERIDPETRQAHLYAAVKTLAKMRRIRAAITTHEETGLNDLPKAKKAHKRYKENFTESLAQACGHCAFKGSCVLEGNPELWSRKHPGEHGVENKATQESVARFIEDLDREPMAHCMPTRNRYHKMRKDVLPKSEL